MDNSEIAAIFHRIADILELQGGDDLFRIRAYRNAALTIQDLPQQLTEMVRQDPDALKHLPSIGPSFREKLEEILNTGTLKKYQELCASIPEGIFELLKLEGLGPKRVKLLHEQLKISSLAELEAACRQGTIASLKGLGAKTQEKLLASLQHYQQTQGRITLSEAWQQATALLAYVRGGILVGQAEMAGSLRRGKETIGDLDVLAIARDPAKAAAHFLKYPRIRDVLQHGETKCSVRLTSGLQVDLRIVEPSQFGAAWVYFTGSKEHNVRLRELAKANGLKVNEYGVFRGSLKTSLAGKTEAEVYQALKLTWMPPEIREDHGELDAAKGGKLPALIDVGDIKGDLHSHTTATDGRNSIEAMIEAAKAKGYEYVAITDHTKSTRVAGGLNEREFVKHLARIRKAAKSVPGIRVLCGAEVDILPDGSLDLPDAILADMDLVVIAVHSHFKMPNQEMTRRILRAMDNRHATILAHPTGRLIGTRAPYEIDLETVIKKAKAHRIFLEVNSHCNRLDLKDSHCKFAKEIGAQCVISTDAHSTLEFANIRYGVTTARRGWLEPCDVVNALPLKAFLQAIKRG